MLAVVRHRAKGAFLSSHLAVPVVEVELVHAIFHGHRDIEVAVPIDIDEGGIERVKPGRKRHVYARCVGILAGGFFLSCRGVKRGEAGGFCRKNLS